MRKSAMIPLLFCAAMMVTACSQIEQLPVSNAQSIVDSAKEQASSWDAFLVRMQELGVTPDDLHSVESTGLTREDIMAMTADEIKDLLAEMAAIRQQNKIDYAREVLEGLDEVRNDPQLAFSHSQGTTNLFLVEELVASIRAEDWGSVTGLILGDVAPLIYDIETTPEKDVTLTTYWLKKEQMVVDKTEITDIYETELFYQFTDHKEVYFSIPKVPLAGMESIDDYKTGSDIPGAPVSAAEAKKAVTELSARFYGYTSHNDDNNLACPINRYGMVIPQDFDSPLAIDVLGEAETDGAAMILGKAYYMVSFYKDGVCRGESYYIDSQNADTAFYVSMVDGSLISVSFKNAERISVVRK